MRVKLVEPVNEPKMGSKRPPKCTKSPQNLPQRFPLGSVYLWSVPLYIILGELGHFGSEKGVKSALDWRQQPHYFVLNGPKFAPNGSLILPNTVSKPNLLNKSAACTRQNVTIQQLNKCISTPAFVLVIRPISSWCTRNTVSMPNLLNKSAACTRQHVAIQQLNNCMYSYSSLCLSKTNLYAHIKGEQQRGSAISDCLI